MTKHIEEARKLATDYAISAIEDAATASIAAALAAAEERGRKEERAKIDEERGYIVDENGNKGWIVP